MKFIIILLCLPFITFSQNVGINETQPKTTLDVKGTTTSDSIVIDAHSLISRGISNLKPLTLSNEGNIVIQSKKSDTGFAAQRIFFGNESGNFAELNGQTESFGIGIQNPQEKLDVNGGIRLTDAVNTNPGTIQYNSTNNTFEGHDANGWVSLSNRDDYKFSRFYRSNQSGVAFNLANVTGDDVLVEMWGYGGKGNGFSKSGGQAGGYVMAKIDITGVNELIIDLQATDRVELTFVHNANNYTLYVQNGEDADTGGPGYQKGNIQALQPGPDKIAVKKFEIGEPGHMPTMIRLDDYVSGSESYIQTIISGDGGNAYGHRSGGRGGVYSHSFPNGQTIFNRIAPTPGVFPGGGGGGGGSNYNTSESSLGGSGGILIHYN